MLLNIPSKHMASLIDIKFQMDIHLLAFAFLDRLRYLSTETLPLPFFVALRYHHFLKE